MIGNGKMLEITCTSQTSDLVKKNYAKSWNDTSQKLADVLDSEIFQSLFFVHVCLYF